VSQQWRAEPPSVKEHWTTLAAEENRKHKEKYPGYKYSAARPTRGSGVSKVRSGQGISRGRGGSSSPGKKTVQYTSEQQLNTPGVASGLVSNNEGLILPVTHTYNSLHMQMSPLMQTPVSMPVYPEANYQYFESPHQTFYQDYQAPLEYQMFSPPSGHLSSSQSLQASSEQSMPHEIMFSSASSPVGLEKNQEMDATMENNFISGVGI
jgi:hypothetical protein